MSCGSALRRGVPARVLLDNNVNFSGIGFGLIAPGIPFMDSFGAAAATLAWKVRICGN